MVAMHIVWQDLEGKRCRNRLQFLIHVRCHRFQRPTTLRPLAPDQGKNEAFRISERGEQSALRWSEPERSSHSGKQAMYHFYPAREPKGSLAF